MSEERINQFSNDVDKLLSDINKCCVKMAERDGFELPKVGGWIKKQDGYWDFIEGKGNYKKIDGEWQWDLEKANPQ
tara:strand:- start:389 stop:616 length:228 start_codon:yes stop_codon:yes gene_type:complete